MAMNETPIAEGAVEAGQRRRPYVLRTEPDGLYALLSVPERPRGLVVFVHDDFPFSPADYRIALFLQAANFATLMVDFLTTEDEDDPLDEFDADLVAKRLDRITEWAAGLREFSTLPFAYFATGVGGAAAVASAAHKRSLIGAMCLLGGRAGFAEDALENVDAPTLVMASATDCSATAYAQRAENRAERRRKLILLTGTGDDVSRAALYSRHWFSSHLS